MKIEYGRYKQIGIKRVNYVLYYHENSDYFTWGILVNILSINIFFRKMKMYLIIIRLIKNLGIKGSQKSKYNL